MKPRWEVEVNNIEYMKAIQKLIELDNEDFVKHSREIREQLVAEILEKCE